jgi:hypothetical protein
LKVTPPAQNNQRSVAIATPAAPRGRGTPTVVAPPQNNGPTPAQMEQMNARRLFASMPALLPTIDALLPGKSAAVRQKMTEMGMNMPQQGQSFAINGTMTADDYIRVASTAPQQVQPRLYQQAAFRALEEGNTERARQIANDYVPANMRDNLMQRIEMRELSKKTGPSGFEEIRQIVNRLQTDNEKVNMLVETANAAKPNNPKLAGQLLEEAKQIVNHRAANYEQFDQQLRVASAFATVDPARSFEILDPAISQINELLSAAQILNGFEINMFREGEMPIQGGNGLTSTISRFGEELAQLARVDFERSDTLAGRFQLAESRIMTRLAIVRGLLNNPRPQTFTGPNINALRGANIVRPE